MPVQQGGRAQAKNVQMCCESEIPLFLFSGPHLQHDTSWKTGRQSRRGSRQPGNPARGICLALALTVWASAAQAQDNPFPGAPFSDPSKFFEQFFGTANRVTPEELARVPISVREEAKIGQQAVRSFQAGLKRQKLKTISRGDDQRYVHQLVQTMKANMKNRDRYREIRVFLIKSKTTDARSFPGGTLFFTTAMLDFADSEAALVGVIGHELSHLDRGHQLDRVRRIKLMREGFGRNFTPESFMRNGMMMMELVMRPFRPEDELQADLDATEWCHAAGYDPREFARLFQRMADRDSDTPAAMPAFLRTHPYHADRMQAVRNRFEELQAETPRTDLYLGRANLTDRVPRSERRDPEE